MRGKIPAIPTVYKGIQFRSRLEARWAVFFDLLGWVWKYEPFDLEGWIPDFALGSKSEPVLVEIKPVFDFHCDVALEINRTSFTGEVLIIGCDIHRDGRHHGYSELPCIGWLRRETAPGETPEEGPWELVPFGCFEHPGPYTEDPVVGFCSANGSWHNRVGVGSGKFYYNSEVVISKVERLWTQAGNLTQWKGRQTITH
jgi:hypothetical protein